MVTASNEPPTPDEAKWLTGVPTYAVWGLGLGQLVTGILLRSVFGIAEQGEHELPAIVVLITVLTTGTAFHSPQTFVLAATTVALFMWPLALGIYLDRHLRSSRKFWVGWYVACVLLTGTPVLALAPWLWRVLDLKAKVTRRNLTATQEPLVVTDG